MYKLLSLILATYLSFDLSAAATCSCAAPGPPAGELNRADAVFSGTVTDISPQEITKRQSRLMLTKRGKE
jgi:hypothetical protein